MFCNLITGTRLDYEGLCKALEQISEVEKRATSRVIHSQVLKGLDLADIRRAGERLVFQDGCKRFFQDLAECKKGAADIHVLSYCWCSDLIQSAFSSGILCHYVQRLQFQSFVNWEIVPYLTTAFSPFFESLGKLAHEVSTLFQ